MLGADVASLDRRSRRALRGGDLQVVFQDPVASLDPPRLPVFDVLAEPLRANGFGKTETDERVGELLTVVGMRREDAGRYPPAEFSGGRSSASASPGAGAAAEDPGPRRTRVGAGRVDPGGGSSTCCWTCRSASLAYLFVSHDLSVVKHLAHRVAVMHKGRIVELGDSEQVFAHPPGDAYTRRLLSAVPRPLADGG